MKKATYLKEASQKFQLTVCTDVSGIPEAARSNVSRFMVNTPTHPHLEALTVSMPIPEKLKQEIPMEFTADAFAIRMEENRVVVYGDDSRGQLYGLMTFLRLLNDEGCFGYGLVCDQPVCTFRGIKLMMPGRDEIGYFKDFIDCMLYFRHNTVMLELGGAMEYKRHPEINQGWEEYAAFMAEYSGKSIEIQKSFPWAKNSIHSNNGQGSYLTQEEVRDLIDYCAQRGITVIPEVPSTSHCDYLLYNHRELAERCEDPYPDTFCPSNPASYELLFDILDEVIEVFHPDIINVGHDEYYSINICDRCRKRHKTNAEIYAEDLTKIHDYLASKGVKTMIWSEKLLNTVVGDGRGFGGARVLVYNDGPKGDGSLIQVIQPTWPARDLIPRDIFCLNWYWFFGEQGDKEIADFSGAFGNFRGYEMEHFRRRCGTNVTGGICSDWGATSPVYLQRNAIYFALAYNDWLYWDAAFDDSDDSQFMGVVEAAFRELFDYNYGAEQNRKGRYIEVDHTTDREAAYCEFVDGIFTEGEKYREDYYLGNYRIRFADGTELTKEIYLGEHIGCENAQWCDKRVYLGPVDGMPVDRIIRLDPRIAETGWSTLPHSCDGKVFYKYYIENPCPGKQIADVRFEPAENARWTVTVRNVREV